MRSERFKLMEPRLSFVTLDVADFQRACSTWRRMQRI